MEMMEEIYKLFTKLQLQEQIIVANQLPTLIKVDFLTQLPLLVAERIISYLPMEDALNCYKVCTRWQTVVVGCREYLMRVCNDTGFSAPWVKDRMNQCQNYCPHALFQLAVEVNTHFNEVKRSLTRIAKLPMSTINDPFLWKIMVAQGLYLALCSMGNIVLYEELQNQSKFTYMGNENGSSVQISEFKQVFGVSWAGVYRRDSLIFTTHHADWLIICKDSIVGQWIDSEVVSSSQTAFATCSKCGIVGQVHPDYGQQQSGMLNWILQYVMLTETQRHATRTRCSLDLRVIDDPSLSKTDVIFLQSIILMPRDDEPNNDSKNDRFCTHHSLLLQFNSSVVNFVVASNCGEIIEISFKYVFNPVLSTGAIKPLLDLKNRRNIFKLSRSKTLLAILNSFTLFIWNIASQKLVSKVNLIKWFQVVDNLRLICVGHIYCVIQYRSEICIISSLTGSLIHRMNVNDFYIARHHDLYLYIIDQDWMNYK